MRQKLTLVVTCTERKSVPALPLHQLRNLPTGPIPVRAARWNDRVSQATDILPLRQLYQGEAWTQVGHLEAAARDAGFDAEVVVVSAGLGLRAKHSLAPAYSATFAIGQPDSVAQDRLGAMSWWTYVSRSSQSLDPIRTFDGPTLFVLSESYANAIGHDLAHLGHREDILIFGGTAGLPRHQRVPADGALRKHLGGTLTSLNARMAIAWLARLATPHLVDPQSRGAWLDWVQEVREVEVFDRTPLQDEAVLDWIRASRVCDPHLSRSRALRKLRDAGLACEQRRFRHLFESLADAQ